GIREICEVLQSIVGVIRRIRTRSAVLINLNEVAVGIVVVIFFFPARVDDGDFPVAIGSGRRTHGIADREYSMEWIIAVVREERRRGRCRSLRGATSKIWQRFFLE